jgi:Oxidoreductase family, NAD-binding Rossmann fold/Oxidoreductase family, C-terminal alpha/beta domain/TAT (twin-arginine translocation) pathway signal sequence
MTKIGTSLHRRRFLKASVAAAGTAALAPTIIPSSALGRDGAVPPSERVVVGGIGIGNRGTYDLGCFLEQSDVQFVAVCDVKEARRQSVKKLADEKYGNQSCETYRDFRELLDRKDIDAVLIATGPNWHATMAMHAARAGKDMYCEKPCTKNIAQSIALADTMKRTGRIFQAGTQRRNLPHFAFACYLARTGKLGKLNKVYAHPAGMSAMSSGWLPAEEAPSIDTVDWDMYLGPAAWRPYNKKFMDGFNFEKGGGLVGGGVLEWGSHCVDLCQWAVGDCPPPIEYNAPADGELVATYESGCKLIFREKGWIPLGSCPVRFEGENGWVEAGDSGKMVLSSPTLLAGRSVEEIGGYPATFHVRDFLDSVKSRSQPKGNAEAAARAHIACHAANVAIFLNRQIKLDINKYEFINDNEANRLRSEAIREPWRI